MLPAAVLQNYQLVIDYRQRSLTVAQPGTLTLTGVAVPATVDPATGLATVDVSIDGHSYAVTLDAGSTYTWLRRSTVEGWLSVHPDWQRGRGAVGASNMRMADDGIESAGILVRIPAVRLGSLTLRDLGALAVGRSKEIGDFMDWYSKKNARPVIGWLGGNALQAFRLAIDYPNRMTYWQRQSRAEARGLEQVGLTLAKEHGRYFVAAVVARAGRPTVEGAQSRRPAAADRRAGRCRGQLERRSRRAARTAGRNAAPRARKGSPYAAGRCTRHGLLTRAVRATGRLRVIHASVWRAGGIRITSSSAAAV